MGGLPKKYTLLNTHLQDKDSSLLVDAGALLFDKVSLPKGRTGKQAQIRAQAVVESYSVMGYEAVAISKYDLAAGVDFLKEIDQQSSFPWLSANLVDSKNNPVFTPYIVKEKAGLRIAIIGLTGQGLTKELAGKKMTILPWQDVLPGLVKDISRQSDVLILLSNETQQQNEAISEQFASIHLIIHSGGSPRNRKPKLHNNTLLFQTDKQGKYLGKMDITWHNSGEWKKKTIDPVLTKKQELDRIKWQVKRLQAKGDPETIFKNKPATLKAYKKLVARKQILNDEITVLEKSKVQIHDKSVYTNTFLELAPEISDHAEIAGIVRKAKQKINAVGKKAATKMMIPGYAGSVTCLKCHEDIGNRWQQTPHARAFDTLVQKKQQFNTKCLPCHVTGVTMEEQDKSLSILPVLHNVGCESCHGAGEKHAKSPDHFKLNSSPATAICLQCHTDDHDDDFNFSRDSKRIH